MVANLKGGALDGVGRVVTFKRPSRAGGNRWIERPTGELSAEGDGREGVLWDAPGSDLANLRPALPQVANPPRREECRRSP